MAPRKRDWIERPLWYDISRVHKRIFQWSLLGMVVLSVLFAMEWQSIGGAVLMGWTWTGMVIHWWLHAVLAGQWHGWQQRVRQLVLVTGPLVAMAAFAGGTFLDALRGIENWDWVLAKLMWERGLYDRLALKFAKQVILAGFVVLAVLALVPPLLWRRPRLKTFLPEGPGFWWVTVRDAGEHMTRRVTTRMWVVGGEWLDCACYFDDEARTVAERWARWWGSVPTVLVVLWHGGSPPWSQLAAAVSTWFFVWYFQLRRLDRTWPWPRHNVGRLAELVALTLEPMSNYRTAPPKGPPVQGHTLVAHFASGRQVRISTTDGAADWLQPVHTLLTRELIENRAKYLRAPQPAESVVVGGKAPIDI